ncbi:MAG TPA: alanine racemase, partial [bacterium]|nr:alanine racemase [bacterium]
MRPTWAEIDLGAIAFNLQGICHRVKPAGIMAVVKADAYGHGALQVSRVALQEGAAYLAVAVVDEAVDGGAARGGASPEKAGSASQLSISAMVAPAAVSMPNVRHRPRQASDGT